MELRVVSLLLLATVRAQNGVEEEVVDLNTVLATPMVDCLSERIQMNIKTKEAFRGRIYLKVPQGFGQ